MHFVIDAGHNTRPGDTGAVGILKEDDLTKELGAKVSELLREAGHQVTECFVPHAKTLNDSLNARIAIANNAKAQAYVSLHFNKFLADGAVTDRAMGTEIYVASNTGRKIAERVLPEITALGFIERSNSIVFKKFAVLKKTKMPALLIETCFLDSEADIATLQKVGIDKLAAAIVRGLLNVD